MAGVYIIQSLTKPERVYVGSALNIPDRWSRHRRALRKNRHENAKLQNHYNKYGEKDFAFEIIENFDFICKEHLLAREQGWFYHFKYKKTKKPFFNIQELADSPIGVKRSEETKKKVGLASKGRNIGFKHPPRSKEAREHYRNSRLGKKASPEARANISKGHKKENLSPQVLENMSKAQKGRKHPQEVKDKIREWNLNRPPFTEEHRNNIKDGIKKALQEGRGAKRNPITGRYE